MIADEFNKLNIPTVEDVENTFLSSDPRLNVSSIKTWVELETINSNPNYPMGEFDSTKWAPEFKRIGVKLGILPENIDAEPGSWLHTWFCCAIMTGYDYAIQKMNETGVDASVGDDLRKLAYEELDEWEEELSQEENCFWGV